jgi:hypothetical protein
VGAAAAEADVAPAGKVRFRQRPPIVGDVVDQQVAVRLHLNTQIVQSGQVAHQSASEMGREQQRHIEALAVEDGKLVKARVDFRSSRNQSPGNADPQRLLTQPIHGKSYLVELVGETPKVTDEQGAIPPLEEYQLVADAIAQLGKPHPLAKFLLERELAVGERVLLPRAVAEELLGLDDEVGTVKRFELTLLRVEPADEDHASPRAVFAAKVETLPDEQSALEMAIEGELVLETETCRSVSAEFHGPVQMTSIERTPEGIFQYVASGEVEVSIRASYSQQRLTLLPGVLRR